MSSLQFKEELLNCLQFALTPEKVKSFSSSDIKRVKEALNKIILTEKKYRTKSVAQQLLKRVTDIQDNKTEDTATESSIDVRQPKSWKKSFSEAKPPK